MVKEAVVTSTSPHILAQTQIDGRIAQLEETLRSLKEDRNGHSGAVRTPPEILTQIFLYVVRYIYDDARLPLEQLSIPHVCRFWRVRFVVNQRTPKPERFDWLGVRIDPQASKVAPASLIRNTHHVCAC